MLPIALIFSFNSDNLTDWQMKKIEMLTESEVVEFQGSPKNGMARTANGRVCLLESHEVSCMINLNDAIHIYSSEEYSLILKSDGEILGMKNDDSEMDFSELFHYLFKSINLWGDDYQLNKFQPVQIAINKS
jgi:hypothetical protein